jgi:hypothetical protein
VLVKRDARQLAGSLGYTFGGLIVSANNATYSFGRGHVVAREPFGVPYGSCRVDPETRIVRVGKDARSGLAEHKVDTAQERG